MDTTYKKVRVWLNSSTKMELDHVAEEAMLTDRQKEIVYLRRKGVSNLAIAFRLHCDIGTINNDIRKIYNILSKIVL